MDDSGFSPVMARIPSTAFQRLRRIRLTIPQKVAAALLAAGFSSCVVAPSTSDSYPNLVRREVAENVFDTNPVRGELRPLRHRKAGFEYRCTECHYSIVSLRRQNPQIPEHANVSLNHGLNTNCQNCHHPTNRDAYVDHEGNEIPSDQPARLCSKCHGPTFRDWEMGIHGRLNGYWDATKGEQTRLFCIQCHDPHDPGFKPMAPLPPPARTRFASKDSGEHG